MSIMKKALKGVLDGHRLEAGILVEEISDASGCFLCENYGLRVVLTEPDGNRNAEEVRGITTSAKRISMLLDLVFKHDVTPVALRDIVDDFIAEDG